MSETCQFCGESTNLSYGNHREVTCPKNPTNAAQPVQPEPKPSQPDATAASFTTQAPSEPEQEPVTAPGEPAFLPPSTATPEEMKRAIDDMFDAAIKRQPDTLSHIAFEAWRLKSHELYDAFPERVRERKEREKDKALGKNPSVEQIAKRLREGVELNARCWVTALIKVEGDLTLDQRKGFIKICGKLAASDRALLRGATVKRLGIKPSEFDKLVKESDSEASEQAAAELIDFLPSEPWPQPVSGDDVLKQAAATFRRFIVFKRELDAEVMALWALGSHLYQEFNVFPRLGFTSPLPECGKTTALDVLEHLALRATRSDNLTTAVAFRIMELHPTLLLDELDTFLHDNPELIGVLNSGHKKGGYVFRMEKVNERQVLKRFPTFGPVGYGMIGHPTTTLFSRTLFVRLERKDAEQKTEDFEPGENSALAEELTTLRRKFARWAAAHNTEVRDAKPETASLGNRHRNNWLPLLKIAQVAGGDWVAQVLEAAGAPPPRARKSDQERLLRDIRNVFHTRGVGRIPSALLVADLIANRETIWYRYRNRHEPLDVNDLAELLGDFGIGPKLFSLSKELQGKLFGKAQDKKKGRGYDLKDFEPHFKKYLSGDAEEVKVSGEEAEGEDF